MARSRPIKSYRHLLAIEKLRPESPAQLRRFAKVMLGLNVPAQPMIPGNQAPMDYLQAAFFEDVPLVPSSGDATKLTKLQRGNDIIIWACRGGGKTMLGAAATLLDLLFKPGIQVRILGGSLEQSGRMYRYLRQMIERPALRDVLLGEPTQRRIELVNGSAVEVLAQSQRSVRGTRVHKLRCDEVEEFRPEVWQAAQLVTRSGLCGERLVPGSIEALSTMHRPYGLMSELVSKADEKAASIGAPVTCGPGVRVLRWCAMDVIEKCEPERDCKTCVLWSDCQGRAKQAAGFVKVDDLIAQWKRCSKSTWDSEMMCRQPRVDDSVFPQFSEEKHVIVNGPQPRQVFDLWIAGCDFGIRSPLVWLWGHVQGSGLDAVITVVDEHAETGLTFERHMELVAKRKWPSVAWVGVDPAGGARNEQTGLSNIELLRRRGWKVRATRSAIDVGIEAIRRRLDRGTLRISARCEGLLRAMRQYHFDVRRQQRDEPVKDGPDHWCDALRYMIVNYESKSAAVAQRSY